MNSAEKILEKGISQGFEGLLWYEHDYVIASDEMVSAIKNTSVVAVGPRTQKELKSFGILCQRTILLSVLARCLHP